MSEEIEHPNVYPKRCSYDGVMYHFLVGKVISGAYFSVHHEVENESIVLFSFSPNLPKDLPCMENVAYVVNHEYLHHLIYCLEGEWATACFDNIAMDVTYWLE